MLIDVASLSQRLVSRLVHSVTHKGVSVGGSVFKGRNLKPMRV